MISLGYANGWIEVPEIRKQCKRLKHVVEQKNIGNCLTEYCCPICKYTYKVDSSD